MKALAERFEFAGVGGLALVGDRRGDPGAPPVLFLHGGGQTRHSWAGTADAVSGLGWQTITVDARGHGESAWAADGDYGLSALAGDVRLLSASLSSPPVLVGASLGGVTSLLLLGEIDPACARGLILVDIIPDTNRTGSERIRAFMAEHAESGFGSLEEVADAIAAYNPHRPKPTDLSGLSKNVRQRNGRWYWHWDPLFMRPGLPDRSLSEARDVDRMHRAVAAIVAAGVPLMLVRGQESDLVSEEKAAQFLTRFPEAEFAGVGGAGHMVAGDRNDAFTDAVVAFLNRHQPRD